jgi:HAD superfamily phosphatase
MRRRAGFDGIVFDMDGVLLDTSRSFTAAVLLAGRACALEPGLRGTWGEREVEQLRLCGGFNNDWDAAAAVATLGPASGPSRGWEERCAQLERLGGGTDAVRVLVGETTWLEVLSRVAPAFQRLYAGPRAREVYGLEPSEPRGLYEMEEPLVSPVELGATGLPFGIFTGRTMEEALLGLERFGLELPAGRMVCDTAPRFRKPRPDGLLELAAQLGSHHVLHVGDTLDDLRSSVNAQMAGLDVAFAGIAPAGSERARRFTGEGALLVRASVREVLSDCFDGDAGAEVRNSWRSR